FTFFLFYDTATNEIYTLSLHDALPIYVGEKNKPNYDEKLMGFFPRLYSSQAHHVQTYKEWTNFKGKKTRASNGEMIAKPTFVERSEEHTSELQSRENLVCRLLLEKKKT